MHDICCACAGISTLDCMQGTEHISMDVQIISGEVLHLEGDGRFQVHGSMAWNCGIVGNGVIATGF